MQYFDNFIGNSMVNFLCIAMIFIVIVYNLRSLKSTDSKNGTGFLILWICITAYSVFYSPMHDDNYTSMASYIAYKSGVDEAFLHFEPIYFRIMDYVPFGYVAYRFVVWGFGAFLLIRYLKWMKFDPKVATVSTLYFALPLLNYQRAIIGYVLLYFGMTLFVELMDVRNGITSKPKQLILAIVCLAAALPFHNSMPFYIAVILASLLLPSDRNIIILFLLVSFFLSITDYGAFFLNHTSEATQRTAERYLENARVGDSANVFGLISGVFVNGPYFGMLAYCAWNIRSSELSFTKYEQKVLMNTIFLVLASLAYSKVSDVVQGKFYMASLLPWSFFLTSFYTRARDNRIALSFVKISIYAFVGDLAIKILSGNFASLFN